MFNNVDGKGFSRACQEITRMIKELKPILWGVIVVMFLYAAGDFMTRAGSLIQSIAVPKIGKVK